MATPMPTSVPLPERPAASLNRTYTVTSGDTPERIALRLGVDVDALRRLNDLLPDDGLRAGGTLLLPATDRELRVVSDERQYVVAPGDSLSAIAKGMGVNLGDLMTANRITNPNLISVGDALDCPRAGAARQRTARARGAGAQWLLLLYSAPRRHAERAYAGFQHHQARAYGV